MCSVHKTTEPLSAFHSRQVVVRHKETSSLSLERSGQHQTLALIHVLEIITHTASRHTHFSTDMIRYDK